MAQGAVELWLGALLQEQQTSLHSVIRSSDWEINDEEFDLLTFLDNFQAQVRRQQRLLLRNDDYSDLIEISSCQ